MNLELQVCSLELAKRLKELGVKQESYFLWIIADHPNESSGTPFVEHRGALEGSYDKTPVCDGWTLTSWSAFTVAELGEMLPDWTETVKRADEDWVCIIRHKHNDINDHSFAETEVDARAKMLIYLLENKLHE